MCPGPGVWSTFSGYCDRKECSHLPAACLQKWVSADQGDAFLILYLGLHILDDVTVLHLQGDDLDGQFSQRVAFWSVSKCEDTMRIQSRIVISKAMHHHLTMPVISLVLMKGKPARCWWITSVPCHTFQWIKNYASFIVWESMICVSLLYLWKKLSCPWSSFCSCVFSEFTAESPVGYSLKVTASLRQLSKVNNCDTFTLITILLWFGASQVALVVKNLPANAGDVRDMGLIPGSGRSPGGGHGNPLQYSCLKNPLGRGAWGVIVHRVAKSWKWLKCLA